MVISRPLSASSIYYDPWHPPCSVHAPDSLFHSLSPSFRWSTSWIGTLHFILHTFLHPIIVFFSQHMPSICTAILTKFNNKHSWSMDKTDRCTHACTHARTHAHTHTQPFYGSVDFVWDNPGEPVPEGSFRHLLDFPKQNEDNTGRRT